MSTKARSPHALSHAAWVAAAPTVDGLVRRARSARHRAAPTAEALVQRVRDTDQRELAAAAWAAAAPTVDGLVRRARSARHRAAPTVDGLVRRARSARHRAAPTAEALVRRVRDTDQRVLAGAVVLLASAAIIGVVIAVRRGNKHTAHGGTSAGAKPTRAKDGHKFVERSVTVNKSRDELYRQWRDFANLPRFMEIVESVEDLGEGRHRWVVTGPGGKTVEYDTVITEDRPGEVIAWKSAPGAEVRSENRIEFKDAPGGRGTEIHAKIDYHPPGGPLGKLAALVTQKAPELQSRRDLRRFKQLVETGEIATTEGPGAAPSSKYSKK